MSRLLLVAGTILVVVGVLAVSNPNLADPPASPPRLLRHVVLFRFKTEATPEQIRAVEQAFAALPAKIPQIREFEWGTNNSPEDHAQGYTHCFLVTFHSETDRAAYLPHPEHQKFVQVLLPILDAVHVVDYWATR